MIGMIRFGARGGVAEAILGDDGCWSCAAVPCLVHPLEILYSPNWEGRPAGRRHLKEAATWLKGTVVFGADSPILGARRSNPGLPVDLLDRRSRPPMALPTKQSDRVTDRIAARMCWVNLGMIHLWVQTAPGRCRGEAESRPGRSRSRRSKAGSRRARGRPVPGLSRHQEMDRLRPSSRGMPPIFPPKPSGEDVPTGTGYAHHVVLAVPTPMEQVRPLRHWPPLLPEGAFPEGEPMPFDGAMHAGSFKALRIAWQEAVASWRYRAP